MILAARFDFFWYAESNYHMPNTRPAKCVSMTLPLDITVADAIAIARKSGGLPKGSPRTGCFEVQNDAGIWRCEDGKRLDRANHAPVFTSWEDS